MDELNILALLFIGGAAALISCLLTFPVKVLSCRLGIMDIPDERKIHKREIPSMGGLAIFISGSLLLLLFVRLYPQAFLFRREILGLILGSTFIVTFGIWDDIRGSAASTRE